MGQIRTDPFWDGKTGGGVRCSSEGEDAARYLDPAAQSLEGNGGRSIASLLPGAYGLRGVVIPRATAFGGSRGFDPQKPRLVNIDPDIKGQCCVVDMSKITKESMEEAFLEAAQNPIAQTDIRLLAAQTFHNLAVGYEPVGMGPSRGPQLTDRRAPIGSGLGTYVVPRAGLGGGQVTEEEAPMRPLTPEEMISPSVQPRGPVLPPGMKTARFRLQENPANMVANIGMPAPSTTTVDPDIATAEDFETEETYNTPPPPKFKDQSEKRISRKLTLQGPPPTVTAPIMQRQPVTDTVPPNTKVTFEMEGWGSFEAAYHEVIKKDDLLILVYDTRFKGGMRWMPPAVQRLMAVRVDGSDSIFFVNSLGTQFSHAGFDYAILIIDQEGNQQNEEAPP